MFEVSLRKLSSQYLLFSYVYMLKRVPKQLNAKPSYKIDPAVFARIAEGDRHAFTKLFERIQPVIYGQALAYLKDRVTAEDVVQDVFLGLWEKRHLLASMENPQGYLMTIARNKIMDIFRRQVAAGFSDALEATLVQPDPSVQTSLEDNERWKKIEAAIRLMPEQRRRVFELNKQEGLSYKEIADRLHVSRDTVKFHLVKAMAFLREVMEHPLVAAFLCWAIC